MSLVLYAPLFSQRLKGSSFYSRDANKFLLTATNTVWGEQGRAFAGTGYITVPNSALLNPALADFSIFAWIKAGADVTDWRKIVSTRNIGATLRYCLYVNKTTGTFIAEANFAGTSKSDACGVVNDNTWHFVGGTWDRDGFLTAYRDAVPSGSPTDISALSAVDLSPVNYRFIGADTITTQRFIGTIGEVWKYIGEALSASAVEEFYESTRWRYEAQTKFTVTVDDIKKTLIKGSLNIEKRIEERSVARFALEDLTASDSYVRGTPVEVFNLTPERIYSGFIDTPAKARISPNGGLIHDISCMDNHYLADKRLVVKPYANQTLGYIVNDIFTTYLEDEGVEIGEVQPGLTIKSAIFNYVSVAEAFDALKELSGFTWFIDELRRLYFIDRATYLAVWDLDGVTHRAIKGSTRLSSGNPLYRNSQYIRGGTGITVLQTQNFTGDGILASFALGYPLALEPTITEDAAPMTVGIKGIDTGKDYYWNKGDGTIYAEVAPAVGVDIEVQYYGQYPLITLAVHPTAPAERQEIEGGTGIVEAIANESEHESAEAMLESAQAKIAQYCQEAEKFSYQTYETGLSPGQLQTITDAIYGLTAHEMLIESVSIRTFGEIILSDIVCITGPSVGSWAKFFSSLLARQDRQIALGDSLLLAIVQQNEDLALVEATDLHSDDFSGGLVNRWIALPPTQSKGHNVEHEALALAEATDINSEETERYVWQ